LKKCSKVFFFEVVPRRAINCSYGNIAE